MADDNTTGTDTTDTVTGTDNQTTEPTSPEDWKAEAEKWKALSRKHETEAKKGSKAAEALAKIEADKLSVEEKLTRERDEALSKLTTFELAQTRREVAADKKLPAFLANRLQGATKEEMMADADSLLKEMGPQKPADLKNGNRGTANKAPEDMNGFIQGLRRGR